jgi:hypothetical protein
MADKMVYHLDLCLYRLLQVIIHSLCFIHNLPRQYQVICRPKKKLSFFLELFLRDLFTQTINDGLGG